MKFSFRIIAFAIGALCCFGFVSVYAQQALHQPDLSPEGFRVSNNRFNKY